MAIVDANAVTNQSVSESKRTPIESETSVVFAGDGAPKSPASMLESLGAIQRARGIEADSYTLGGVVEELEQRMARMLGKETAVFMPTGTLANHLALRQLCDGKPRVVVQEPSHLYNDTGDCVQQLSGINMVPLAPGRTCFTLDELEATVDRSDSGRVANPVGAVMIESPVRRQGGRIVPIDDMKAITEYCSERGIGTHLDGARLYMMSATTGIAPSAYSALFDTVYVSLYKYFGAPFGAILAGTEEFCQGLYHLRRMFGGGLSSSALAAALALDGIDGFEPRFAEAMTKASALFESLNELDGIQVGRYEHGSNLFPLTFDDEIDPRQLDECLRRQWVFFATDRDDLGNRHLTVNVTLLRQSNDDLVDAFRQALER